MKIVYIFLLLLQLICTIKSQPTIDDSHYDEEYADDDFDNLETSGHIELENSSPLTLNDTLQNTVLLKNVNKQGDEHLLKKTQSLIKTTPSLNLEEDYGDEYDSQDEEFIEDLTTKIALISSKNTTQSKSTLENIQSEVDEHLNVLDTNDFNQNEHHDLDQSNHLDEEEEDEEEDHEMVEDEEGLDEMVEDSDEDMDLEKEAEELDKQQSDNENNKMKDINSSQNKSRLSSLSFKELIKSPALLAGIFGGLLVGIITALLLIVFIIYRMRKRDEGSYLIGQNNEGSFNYAYMKAPTKEFYA